MKASIGPLRRVLLGMEGRKESRRASQVTPEGQTLRQGRRKCPLQGDLGRSPEPVHAYAVPSGSGEAELEPLEVSAASSVL